MKLEKLRQNKDKYLIPYVFKQIELIKEILKISSNSRIYFLGWKGGANLFLYKNKVIVSFWKTDKDEKNNYITHTLTITNLYVITLLKEYPKNDDDIVFEKIKETDDEKYISADFLNWIDMPSTITEEVDLQYYEIIKFLQKYNKNTFRSVSKTGDYLFYSKKDDEFCYTLNLYMKDLKNNAELKLYIPEKFVKKDNGEWIATAIPQNLRDFIAVDLSSKLSQHKITKAKKAFLKFANEYCSELKTQNFFALEFIKQTIQPVDYNYGWSVARISSDIWIYDFMEKDEEPYFIVADSVYSWDITKVAVIDIKNAKYHDSKPQNKNIYKKGRTKFKKWKLDKKDITKLIEFFKSPVKSNECRIYNSEVFKKYVKTNWELLIYVYNINSAYWEDYEVLPNGKNEYGIIQVPFDTPMPDYMELLEEN